MEKLSKAELLNEDTFWDIINKSLDDFTNIKNQLEKIKNQLIKLTDTEIIGFDYIKVKLLWQAYNSSLWAVNYTVTGCFCDDEFVDFRLWLITRGEETYYNALENPDSLVDEFDKIPLGGMPLCEELLSIEALAFKEKNNKDFYVEEEKYYSNIKIPELKINWDEKSIKKIIPNTYNEWNANDRF
ncbi:MAG: DUF4240 domain-containing protein [Clostridiales bacterium]